MRHLSVLILLATLATSAVAQPAPTSSAETLRVVAPWFGVGLGTGRVIGRNTHPGFLEAGPSLATTLHAGVNIATRIFLGAKVYHQAGFILEDSKNSANFSAVTVGTRIWRGLVLEGGRGTGTYTIDDSHPVHNAPARELGLEVVSKPRPAQVSAFLQYYRTRAASSASGYSLSGLAMGGSLRIYLLDAILNQPR